MRKILILIFVLNVINTSFGQDTYYSIANDVEWSSPSSWSLNSSGVPSASQAPGATDNVVIRHEIILDTNIAYTHFGNIEIRQESDLGKLISNQRFIFSGREFIIQSNCSFGIETTADSALIIQSPNSSYLSVLDSRGQIHIDNNNPGTVETSIINFGKLLVTGPSTTRLRTTGHLINGSILEVNPIGPTNPDFEIGSISLLNQDADLIFLDNSSSIINAPIEGTADMLVYGTNSTICGDTLNGRITIGGNVYSDSLIFRDGASLQNTVCKGFKIYRFGNTTPFPVEIISITIKKNELLWEVIERNIQYYEIQYSIDISNWDKVGLVDSRGSGRNYYSYNLLKKGYYRLKIYEISEKDKYSEILHFNGTDDTAFYPNLVTSGNSIHFTGSKLIRNIYIYNTNGTLAQKLEPQTESAVITQSPGLYIVKIEGERSFKTGKLIVQ